METLPEEVAVVINDFRFGTPSFWKRSFKSVVSDLDDNIHYIHYLQHVYTESEYLDLNDDCEYIYFFRVSILLNSLWRWKRELIRAFPKLDF